MYFSQLRDKLLNFGTYSSTYDHKIVTHAIHRKHKIQSNNTKKQIDFKSK